LSDLLPHQVRGAGEPVLLLNGGMMTFAAWEPIAAPLAERFRLLLCDFRGQLLSPLPAPARLEEHVEDVVRLLGSLVEGPVHVLGTSFGAEVGLLLAALHPERVRTLTLVAATDLFSREMFDIGEPVLAACREALSGGDRGRVLDAISAYAYRPEWLERNREALAARRTGVAALPDRWFSGVAALIESLRGVDLTPRLGAIRCPVHVVAAGRDAVMPLERVRSLAAKVPGARLTEVPGAGHALVAEDPARVVEIFLADRAAK
jgi:3-oxoadipate enol-lactonase